MIISRTPLRVGLAGGGTDVEVVRDKTSRSIENNRTFDPVSKMGAERSIQSPVIVLFTTKNSHCAEILREIKGNGIPIRSIIIENRFATGTGLSPRKIINKSIEMARKGRLFIGIRFLIGYVIRRINKKRTPVSSDFRENEFYRNYSSEVYSVDNFNGPDCESLLKRINPDLLVLGGSRILKKNILEIPKMGVLNAHPGILPKYRGVDVISWAILNGDNIGVTVHLVDEGIDTGRICAQEIIPVNFGVDTIESLKRRAERVSGQLMARVLKGIIETGKIETSEVKDSKGPLYLSMERSLKKKVRKRLSGK